MADVRTYFDDKAELYASSRPVYPREWFAFLSDQCSSHGAAWDCATGNGQAAVHLAAHFTTVQASDISESQISHGFQHPAVRYTVSPADSTPYADGAFDLVNVAQALHWFDLDLFWDEVRRVSRPGALFAAYCYAWPSISPDLDAILDAAVKQPVNGFWAPNNRLCWNGYKDVQFPFQKLETPEFNLLNTWTGRQFLDFIHSWSAVRRKMEG